MSDVTSSVEGYYALHAWVNYHKGRPTKCEHCGTTTKKLQWANKSHEYRRQLDDWLRLCYSCHSKHDYKPSCPNGHVRNEANVYVNPSGARQCRPCRLNATHKYHDRLRREAALTEVEKALDL